MDNQQFEYSQYKRLAEYAAKDILLKIQTAVSGMGDPFLFRAKTDPWRLKSESSLLRKAKERSWTLPKALHQASDLLGFRLVCNNLQDVLRVSTALTSVLNADGTRPERQDYIKKPKPDGYRGIHLMFRYPVKMGSVEVEFGCEIQVRSMLQDTWARLSRVDLYTNDIAAPIMRQMQTLAEQLAKADITADRIRNRISRPRRGETSSPGQFLTASTVTFLFQQAFGREPPDYLIQWITRDYGLMSLRSDGLDAELRDEEFQMRLSAAYGAIAQWNAEAEQLFRWSVHALAYGREAAVKEATKDGRTEWREIDLTARREMMSCLPEDPDSLAASFEYRTKDDEPAVDIEQASFALGVTRSCSCCGTLIVDPDELAEAALLHYKLRGKRAQKLREEIQSKVRNSGVETGSWDNLSLCSSCDYRLSKDE